MNTDRKQALIQTIKTVLAELAGSDLSGVDPRATFFELGFDSLLLTQAAAILKNKLQVQISFRQLLDQLTTIDAIATYADQKLPAGGTPAEPVKKAAPTLAPAAPSIAPATIVSKPVTLAKATPTPIAPASLPISSGNGHATVLERVMKEQLALMAKQLEMLRGTSPGATTSLETMLPGSVASEAPVVSPAPETPAAPAAAPQPAGEQKSFGPYRPINTSKAPEFTAEQQKALDELIRRYTAKTPTSKKQTQEARAYFADPRSVAGFRTFWKEMVYPIITERSKGARFWDVDGNEFIDVTMGFGTNLLGHLPSFVETAIAEQLKKGIEVGPQSPLAGKAAKLMCELTGHERAAFCNTGSEAVLAAIRVARTVTGRTRIATFTGAFHGICDEVLVRGNVVGGKRVSMPIAPGIPRNAVSEVLVLEYGTQESLEILKQHMSELALVLVEPVQSRHPDLQPGEFLRQLRRLTAEHDTPLLFDEVITGFRCNLKGAQEYFGVKADLASWGKVIAGGMPVGALTGSAKYMDALDGGFWQYGDNSFPEVGVTFFAGTYVRHPLTMAACCAVLNHLKEQGPRLQEKLTAKAEVFAAELRVFLKERAVPLNFEQFASIFYFHFGPEIKHGSLFWFYLRDKGIHFWENRPCFFSTAHSDADIAYFLQAIKETIVEMQAAGFFPPPPAGVAPFQATMAFPKLGDESGQIASQSTAALPAVPNKPVARSAGSSKPMGFGVYFFGNYPAEYRSNKYRVIIEAARFADQNGFTSIWIPERHFHPVGGFSANPSIIAAALARETKQLKLRAGSVVLPLHHPVRVAEEWAMVDNLSEGRVGISIASGWHPNDFVFAPESFDRRREISWEGWEVINKLWQGQEISFPAGNKGTFGVKLHPMPKQSKLPVWLTCIHKESYIKAGELGMGVLGYTMNTTLADLTEKIRLYREAFAKAGHDPRQANVTILLHTFVGPNREVAREIARRPLREYLRSYLDNSSKRIESQNGAVPIDQDDIEFLLDRAFDDYVNGKSLIGSPESCAEVVANMAKIGVDEIGCFLDFGISDEQVLAHLPHLSELQRLCNSGEAAPVAPRTIDLPEAQKGLVAVAAMGTDACRTYTEGNTLDLRGALDIEAMRRALQRCVDRHEALRTALAADGQSQIVYPNVALEVPLEDFSGLTEETRSTRLQEFFRDMESVPADLNRAPGLRAKIVKLTDSHHLLLAFFHHTTGNGPSYWIFFEDLCAFYEEECGGNRFDRPEPMQFSAYVDWRRKQQSSPEHAAAETFWLNQFVGGLPILELPTDRPRPELKNYLGGRVVLRLDASLTRQVRQAGASLKCSLYMTLLAAYKTLMHRLSGQDDVVVATPFDSEIRSLPGGEGLFANTTNMTLLRSQISSQTTYAELLAATRNQILECREHQDFFFGSLAQKLGLRAGSGKSVMFSVSFNYESGKFERQAGGIKVEYLTDQVPYRCPKDAALADLNLNVAEQNGELVCECDYDAELFDGATVARMLGQWKTLLEGIVANPGCRLSEIPLLTAVERQKILGEWNRTELDYPQDRCVHELIEDQAKRQPEAIAVVHQDQKITYRELNERVERLGAFLQGLGVKPGSLVAICVDRSVEMVVGMLGILKAGGAYVPVDPSYPADRLAFMFEDAQPKVVLTQEQWQTILPKSEARVVLLDKEWQQIAREKKPCKKQGLKSTDRAYVIFTSGSTGRPKGVEIPHRALVNFLTSMQQKLEFTAREVLVAVTTLSFDIAGLELFLPLITGAKVIVASREVAMDGGKLAELLQQSGATVMQATPATWHLLIEAGWKGNKEFKALCGGEAWSGKLAEELGQRSGALWNLYGPTETTIWSAALKVGKGEPVLIGLPIGNTQLYVLDKNLQLAPVGVPGELWIGGDGLALGYLKRPELTAEKFVLNPYNNQAGAKMYRTGDLVRQRLDGKIEFLNRIDNQVKIRGYRIELGEIEAQMASHLGIKEATVIAREDTPGHKRLVAYFIAQNGQEIKATALREYLQGRLPEYMIPVAFVGLEQFPQTPNGKINRKGLPKPEMEVASVGYVEPVTPGEIEMAKIWSEVLNVSRVGVNDNFFELGGDSLIGFRAVNRANQAGLAINLNMLFRHKTIAEIIKAIGKDGSSTTVPARSTITRASRETHKRKLQALN